MERRVALWSLLLPLVSLLSIASDACCEAEMPVPIERPLAVALDRLSPAQRELLEDLLDKARREPMNGLRRGQLGMAYETNGYPRAALMSYRQAEELDGQEPKWPYYQAFLLAGRGELQRALDALDRSIRLDAKHVSSWMWKGTWLIELGLVRQADDAFSEAKGLGLGWAATAGQARVLLHQDRSDEAIAILEPLSEVSPFPSVFQLLGRAYRESGRLDEARISLARGKSAQRIGWHDDRQEAKRAYEVGVTPRLQQAQRLILLSETEQALPILEALVEAKPNDERVINTLSNAYVLMGREDEAFAVLRNALEQFPVHYRTHLNVAGVYENRGDWKLALQHIDAAIRLNPTVSLPYEKKGLLLQRQRRLVEALDAFELALNRNASDPHLFARAGDIEAILRRWLDAIERYRDSIRVDPSYTLGHIKLGLSLARTGQFEAARNALSVAAALDTHERDVQEALAFVSGLEHKQNSK
ncbi:MAG: tetratricopeptide repeat protein [Pseudomonadota bacterium]|nr:tetratricopeptide repeat protein [Pseudomonadota bacterium]